MFLGVVTHVWFRVNLPTVFMARADGCKFHPNKQDHTTQWHRVAFTDVRANLNACHYYDLLKEISYKSLHSKVCVLKLRLCHFILVGRNRKSAKSVINWFINSVIIS